MPAGKKGANWRSKSPITNRPRPRKASNTNRPPRQPMKFAPRVVVDNSNLPKWEERVPQRSRVPTSLFWPAAKLLFRRVLNQNMFIGFFRPDIMADGTLKGSGLGYPHKPKNWKESAQAYTKRPNIWVPDLDGIFQPSVPLVSKMRLDNHKGMAPYYDAPMGRMFVPGTKVFLPKSLPLEELEMSYEAPMLAVDPQMGVAGMFPADLGLDIWPEPEPISHRPFQFYTPSINYNQINHMVDLQTNPLSWVTNYVTPTQTYNATLGLFEPVPPSGYYWTTETQWIWGTDPWTGYPTFNSVQVRVFDQLSYDLDMMNYEMALVSWNAAVTQQELHAQNELRVYEESLAAYHEMVLDIKQKDANIEFVISAGRPRKAQALDPSRPYRRNDKKADSAGRGIYRRFLRITGLTYGAVSESYDLLTAFANNITDKDGGRLHSSMYYRIRKYMRGEAELDMLGFARDAIYNELIDLVHGRIGRLQAAAYHGTSMMPGQFKALSKLRSDLDFTAYQFFQSDLFKKVGASTRARLINKYVHKVDFTRKSSWSDRNAPLLSPDFVDYFRRVRYDSVRRDRDTSDEGSDPID